MQYQKRDSLKMLIKRYPYRFGLGAVVVIALFFYLKEENIILRHPRDYGEIERSGVLRVTTEYGSNSYYIDENDEIKGFYYSLIKEFADEHGLELEVIPEMSLTKQNEMLKLGRCDLIANGRMITTETKEELVYTIPITVDRQVIVQRIPQDEEGCDYLFSQIGLGGQIVGIPKGSPFLFRIKNIMKEIGDTIMVKEIGRYSTEQILAMVAYRELPYAICEEKVVRANIAKFPELDKNLVCSFNQFYSWAVNEESPVLLDSLNTWLRRKGFDGQGNRHQ